MNSIRVYIFKFNVISVFRVFDSEIFYITRIYSSSPLSFIFIKTVLLRPLRLRITFSYTLPLLAYFRVLYSFLFWIDTHSVSSKSLCMCICLTIYIKLQKRLTGIILFIYCNMKISNNENIMKNILKYFIHV